MNTLADSMRTLLNRLQEDNGPTNPNPSAPTTPPSTDPKQQPVQGAEGSVDAEGIATMLGLNNPSAFVGALTQLRNNPAEKSVGSVINDVQAWELADAFWKLISTDSQTRMKIMGMLHNLHSDES